jgi:serine/threonine-protein kinase
MVLAVAVVAGAIWSLTQPISRPVTRFLITPEPTAPLANVSSNELAISPDGSSTVYLSASGAGRQLYLRRRDEITATPIPGTEGSFGDVFFSPDGESVAFFTIDQLKTVSLLGGGAISVCNTELGGVSGTWGPDDLIVFSDATYSLYRVSADGGEPQILASPNSERGEIYYRHPEILPGGKAVLFTVWGNEAFQTRVLSLETGDQEIVVEGGRQAHYLPEGYLVYERAGNLWTVPFDLGRLEISGDAVPVLEGIRQQNFAADYALSTNGTLVYVPGTEERGDLIWVDRDGTHQSLMESESGLEQPRLSPDGKRVAFKRAGAGEIMRGVGDIWIYELSRGTSTPLTFDGFNTSPIWTLDGKQITFGKPVGVFSIPADGSGEASQLTTTTADTRYLPGSWSPDGVLAYSEGALGNQDIYVLTLEGKGEEEPFMVTEFDEKQPVFSPDGMWIAFISNRSGRDEVYVKPYPGEGGIMPISTGGGEQPVWARSGKELFYRSGQQTLVVSVETQPTFKAETPRVLFDGFYPGAWFFLTSNYDISPDGQRFLMVEKTGNGNSLTQINVVQNWFSEVKRLVPTN